MEKINRHNYEAFFLDFAEGNLSPDQIRELEAFLDANPDLRDELDGFEIITLPITKPEIAKWASLKKPGLENLKADSDLRDAFFIRAIENELNPLEEKILNELIADKTFKEEYDLWQNTVLLSGNKEVEKQNLFQFGLDRNISDFNYEYYLTARTEGLLTPEQNTALERFAIRRPGGRRELEIADHLKLTPPKGVFYPDKESLYKKEKPILFIWLYRAAAVAAVLFLGVLTWINVSSPFAEKAPIAIQEKHAPTHTDDTIGNSKTQPFDTLRNTETREEPLLEDWEVREPDPVEYAETIPEQYNVVPIEEESEKQEMVLEKIEIYTGEELAVVFDNPKIMEDTAGFMEVPNQNPANIAQANTTKTYNSIPKFAGSLLADKLNIPENEKDDMALVVARRLTTRTGELLDAEYTKEQSEAEGNESLTYTFRIGSFRLSHTKAK